MKRFGSLLLLALLTRPAHAAPTDVQVNVNVDLTDAGRKLTLPTREHPAYFLPIVSGFRQQGAISAHEKVPPPGTVLTQLAKTLAENGYLVVGPKTPPPSVLLVFTWGSMNPEIDEFGDPDDNQKVFYNQSEMLSLVGGQTLHNLDLDFERESVRQGAEQDRYFVMVTAYDFAAAQQKKKVLLWRTKMSTEANAVDFADVMKALITSGGPLLGKETTRPVWVHKEVIREGTVKLGELTVLPDKEPEPAPKSTKPPKKQ